jgi:anti-sigma B factor antagonist
MAEPALRVELVRQDDASAVVAVAGEIDLATAPVLSSELETVAVTSGTVVHVDLAEVSFLDSSGISALVEFRKRLEQADASLVLHRAGPTIQRVLEISGLGALFELRPDAPV